MSQKLRLPAAIGLTLAFVPLLAHALGSGPGNALYGQTVHLTLSPALAALYGGPVDAGTRVVNDKVEYPSIAGGTMDVRILDTQILIGSIAGFPLNYDAAYGPRYTLDFTFTGGQAIIGVSTPTLADFREPAPLAIFNTDEIVVDLSEALIEPDHYLGIDVVTLPVAAVPEPATWAMMILGVAGLGARLRGRRNAPAPVV